MSIAKIDAMVNDCLMEYQIGIERSELALFNAIDSDRPINQLAKSRLAANLHKICHVTLSRATTVLENGSSELVRDVLSDDLIKAHQSHISAVTDAVEFAKSLITSQIQRDRATNVREFAKFQQVASIEMGRGKDSAYAIEKAKRRIASMRPDLMRSLYQVKLAVRSALIDSFNLAAIALLAREGATEIKVANVDPNHKNHGKSFPLSTEDGGFGYDAIKMTYFHPNSTSLVAV